MKSKLFTIILLLILAFSASSTAQNIIYSNDEDTLTRNTNDVHQNQPEQSLVKKQNKTDYTIELGTSFSTSNFGNALCMYTKPEIRYRLAPKMNLRAGFIFTNNSITDYYSTEKGKQYNYTNAYAFAGIDYLATERLKISGEILYGMNNSPYAINQNRNSDYYVRFSAEYKITKNFSVGLQVINQNLGYPNYMNSFNNYNFGGFNGPFRNYPDF